MIETGVWAGYKGLEQGGVLLLQRVCRPSEQREEYAVEKNIVFEGGMGELGLSIEGVLRRAARSLIEQAIETERAVLLEEFWPLRSSGTENRVNQKIGDPPTLPG